MSRAWPVNDIDPEGSLGSNARRILAVRMAEYYSYGPIVPIESAVTEHHNLRIAAKRLRYTLELFRTVFGDVGERQIERVRAIQEELGTLHDHDVRIDLIQDELVTLAASQTTEVGAALASAPGDEHAAITATALRPPPDDPRRGLLSLLGREHVARRQCYQSFRALWERLAEEGMRSELAQLSSLPTAGVESVNGANGRGPTADAP
jgi:hypothetical protein